MSTRKSPPERSKIQRQPSVAYARRQKGENGEKSDKGEKGEKGEKDDDADDKASPDTKKGIVTPDDLARQIDKIPDAAPDERTPKPTEEAEPLARANEHEREAPAKRPMVTAESPRARTATMMAESPIVSQPPAMPSSPPPVDVSMGGIEDPTNMPGPREIPGGHPTDPASAPGHVPAGDSRSFRRDTEFALVYRRATFVISRFGQLGTRGQWRVVEYPTSASASHAYAKEASRFVSDGFSDYRD